MFSYDFWACLLSPTLLKSAYIWKSSSAPQVNLWASIYALFVRLHHTVFCLFLSSLYAICNCHSMCHQRWHGDSMNVEHCCVCCDLFETFWWKITCDYRNVKTTLSYCCSQFHFHMCRQITHTHTHTASYHLCQQYWLTPSLHPPPSCCVCLKPLQHAPKLFGVPKWTPVKASGPIKMLPVNEIILQEDDLSWAFKLQVAVSHTTHESLNVSLRLWNISVVPD